MKCFFTCAFILLIVGCTPESEIAEDGSNLYLNRLENETYRAQFRYAQDCRLIAKIMSDAERATWYCK